ncbi:hypothetical protein LEP1GSC127_2535 [Leptospira kirschneri str. 200801925]|nr:hypothetical protein LEP1GSC127_2535 [Leptospira kirschneri str. 200801925]
MRIFPPTGLVYKLRDKQVHCIEEWEIPEILLCPNSDTILPHPAGFTFRVRVDEQGERIVSEEKRFQVKSLKFGCWGIRLLMVLVSTILRRSLGKCRRLSSSSGSKFEIWALTPLVQEGFKEEWKEN